MRLAGTDLVCIRGGRPVFVGIEFSVKSQEALLVTGRNGAGKSSLLRMVAGLLHVAGGQLALTGGQSEHSIGEQAHYLGHQDALKPSLTVEENLRFWSRYLGDAAMAPNSALAELGLDSVAHMPAAYLSAGQRRRLSLARLITTKRPIWLLDEPTSSLDAAAQAKLTDLMHGHLADGGLILAATHAPIGLEPVRELKLDAAA